MKLLTKKTDYAVRALLRLAQHDGRLSARRIAAAEHIPLQFLRAIVQTLAQAGYVTTREGVTGGVALARAPRAIRLADILQLFQGTLDMTECLFRKKVCRNRATCVLRHRLLDIEHTVLAKFQRITIASLLKDLNAA
ncbi:MAG: Rrf2 family transcriptional regulator [bacterium]|nr:Rrf2 family transcriptional regulator [bacterium]